MRGLRGLLALLAISFPYRAYLCICPNEDLQAGSNGRAERREDTEIWIGKGRLGLFEIMDCKTCDLGEERWGFTRYVTCTPLLGRWAPSTGTHSLAAYAVSGARWGSLWTPAGALLLDFCGRMFARIRLANASGAVLVVAGLDDLMRKT